MEKVTISYSKYQGKIDAFSEALNHLKEAMRIIEEQNPTLKEHQQMPAFGCAWYDAESECSAATCSLSDIIGHLVAENLKESYL